MLNQYDSLSGSSSKRFLLSNPLLPLPHPAELHPAFIATTTRDRTEEDEKAWNNLETVVRWMEESQASDGGCWKPAMLLQSQLQTRMTTVLQQQQQQHVQQRQRELGIAREHEHPTQNVAIDGPPIRHVRGFRCEDLIQTSNEEGPEPSTTPPVSVGAESSNKETITRQPSSDSPTTTTNVVAKRMATRESTRLLRAWLIKHQFNPYPTKGEKIMLSLITRMNLTQISTWFANARRRLKKDNQMTWCPRSRHGSMCPNLTNRMVVVKPDTTTAMDWNTSPKPWSKDSSRSTRLELGCGKSIPLLTDNMTSMKSNMEEEYFARFGDRGGGGGGGGTDGHSELVTDESREDCSRAASTLARYNIIPWMIGSSRYAALTGLRGVEFGDRWPNFDSIDREDNPHLHRHDGHHHLAVDSTKGGLETSVLGSDSENRESMT